MRYLLACVCACMPVSVYAQAEAIIKGPEKVNPGDLVILDSTDSTGSAQEWRLVNSDKTYLPLEGRCVFASGTAGSYVFVLSVADCDDLDGASVSMAVHTVVVGTPPKPKPVIPPEPDVPEPELTGHTKTIFNSLKTVRYKAGEIETLSNNIKKVASKSAGLSWTPRQMNEELGRLNSTFRDDDTKQRWKSWMDAFSGCLADVRKDNQGSEAIAIFMEIADGMDEFAWWKSQTSTDVYKSVSGNTLSDTLKSMKDSVGGLKEDLNSIKQEIGQ